ncbi:unnamed protein product [Soboliphyme baturini]|uniref:DM domain-containing protein n=1 Tax=Soboliphyme baturini TaxID=241478 RepID=A0A3P7ZT82_9BILA|nr:unnamed protein product [Soboliphyme baturini]
MLALVLHCYPSATAIHCPLFPVNKRRPLSIFSTSRTYHCQRCLNHGKKVARKGHKRFCQWGNCTCVQCSLVEKRKILNRKINSEREAHGSLSVDREDIQSQKSILSSFSI